MNGVMNKTQFTVKRYRDKIKTEKKQIQVNIKMLKENGFKKQSNRKWIKGDTKQHEIINKRGISIDRKHIEF